MPTQADGTPASSTNPATWTSFDEAAKAAGRFDGIGFVFGPDRDFFGIDLDGCRDQSTGKVAEWAREVILFLDSYAEVSPSKTGVKIFCRGRLPFDTGKKTAVAAERVCKDKEPAIEAYDHGRYFAATGWTLAGMPAEPQDRTEQVKEICNLYFRETSPARAGQRQENFSRLAVIERARKYLDRLPPSLSGQGGHGAAFHAACVLVLGFQLNKSEALVLFSEFNQRCQPPWSEKELIHKLESAEKQPGERGYLRDAKPEDWAAVNVPAYAPPPEEAKTGPASIVTLQAATAEYLADLKAGRSGLLSLGISEVDYALGGGVAFGEVVIVAARTSHGKSAFAMQCLDTLGKCGHPTAIISEEMSAKTLGKRTIQFAIDTPEDCWPQREEEVRAGLAQYFRTREPCYVVEACRSVDIACEAITRMVEEKKVRAVAVDYAQLLNSKSKSPYERVTNVSIALRQCANKTGILLLMLCQLSREIEKRESFTPHLADLKESGQLEQDADSVLFLVWPHKINPKNDPKEYQVWIAKNRNRAINQQMVKCEFNPSRLRVTEYHEPITLHPNYIDFGEHSHERQEAF